jgi:hypothetical protein
MVVPPVAVFFFVRAVELAFFQLIIPGLVPGLCGGAWRSDEAVVEHDAA